MPGVPGCAFQQRQTWYAVDGNASLLQVLHLLAPPPENVGVPSLEAHHSGAALSKLAQELMDFCLCACVEALLLAHVYHAG